MNAHDELEECVSESVSALAKLLLVLRKFRKKRSGRAKLFLISGGLKKGLNKVANSLKLLLIC